MTLENSLADNCGYACDASRCKKDCQANAPYKTFGDCTSHCKTKKKELLWIILGSLGAILLGVLVWVIVARVKHSRQYRVDSLST